MTIHFQTSLARNSDNIKYKTQKPFNENQSLKSTDLRQTQRFIESWSISTALVPYSLRFSQVYWYYNSNIISKLYCAYRNHVAIPIKKWKHKTQKNLRKTNNRTSKNSNNICGDAIRQLLWVNYAVTWKMQVILKVNIQTKFIK